MRKEPHKCMHLVNKRCHARKGRPPRCSQRMTGCSEYKKTPLLVRIVEAMEEAFTPWL